MKNLVFFNNKGGVGKTSLVYHLAWMFAELGRRVVAVDLDPQANLSTMFLPEDRLEELWTDEASRPTIQGALSPILHGTGDIRHPHVEAVSGGLSLVVGDLELSRFEAKLSWAWPVCLDRDTGAFRVISAFSRIIQAAAGAADADLALIDVGPNLGAINRSAILAANFVAVPLAADLFSLQVLRNLGPTLRDWRTEWTDRVGRKPSSADFELPAGEMDPIGYVVLQHAVRLDRPVKAYERWLNRIPETYSTFVLGQEAPKGIPPAPDPHCLATLNNDRSLMPLAQEAQKPMFFLKPGDGALGGHMSAVTACFLDFKRLAEEIGQRIGLEMGAEPSVTARSR